MIFGHVLFVCDSLVLFDDDKDTSSLLNALMDHKKRSVKVKVIHTQVRNVLKKVLELFRTIAHTSRSVW